MSQQVQVIRSPRRKKTVSARMVDGRVEVRIPSRLSKSEEERVVKDILASLEKKMTSTVRSDEELLDRAKRLNRQVLEGRATIGSIKWVTNQSQRWGSCSPMTNDIRISHKLQQVPDYVLNAVIVHELVHTFVHSGHSPEFREWADLAPKAERAKGYLEALGRGLPEIDH